jgi:phage protein D
MSGTLTIAAPAARQPRIGMRVNGEDAAGLVGFVARNNAYRAADTFTATVSLSAAPAELNAAFWAGCDTIDIELLAWLEDETMPGPIVRGLVDKAVISLDAASVTLTGRDYSSLLIDTRTSEKFANQTLSEIAATLAARHVLPNGQTMAVDAVPTATRAGDFYQAGNAALTDEVSEWALLQWLAEQEGLDVYVTGATLNVQPAPGRQTPPLGIIYAPPGDGPAMATAGRIELARVLTLARDIEVTVRSWNHGAKRAVTVTMRGSKIARTNTQSGMPPHQYSFVVPGLDQAAAEQLAANMLTELTRHERALSVLGLPGLPDLTVRRMVRLVGTETDFDQDYYIHAITRRFGWQGASMDILAKNCSPRSEVTI